MILVLQGAQDGAITGNPQITFFKQVYRRYTNFSRESQLQSGTNLTPGNNASVTVSRTGDLAGSAYLEVHLPTIDNTILTTPAANKQVAWANFAGLALIDYMTVDIGGTTIDKQYGLWMYAWQELTMPTAKASGYDLMVGAYAQPGSAETAIDSAQEGSVLHVPLTFWFNTSPGLALPLIALQYHEVKYSFQFRSAKDLINVVDTATNEFLTNEAMTYANNNVKINLYQDYYFLDTPERRKFAQMSHEYLIEQVQKEEVSVMSGTDGTVSNTLSGNINFNHPVKELVWMLQRDDVYAAHDWFNFANSAPGQEANGTDLLASANFEINGHQIFNGDSRNALYFRQMQPFMHHTAIPATHIYCYSFALRPEEHQPSGTCNFSRIDTAVVKHTVNHTGQTATLHVFAKGYNVLRIMSGMGGLAYSN